MLIIPRNSLKFRLLVDSNPTFARSNVEPSSLAQPTFLWSQRMLWHAQWFPILEEFCSSKRINIEYRSHQQGVERREFREPR